MLLSNTCSVVASAGINKAVLFIQEDLRLLTDIGFIAASRGLNLHARSIFTAVRSLRPQSEAGHLGLGIVDILSGDPASAVSTLSAAPRTTAVNTFLGIALLQSAEVQRGQKILRLVVGSSAETPLARIASEALALAEVGA